jgi:hypothetical protein
MRRSREKGCLIGSGRAEAGGARSDWLGLGAGDPFPHKKHPLREIDECISFEEVNSNCNNIELIIYI